MSCKFTVSSASSSRASVRAISKSRQVASRAQPSSQAALRCINASRAAAHSADAERNGGGHRASAIRREPACGQMGMGSRRGRRTGSAGSYDARDGTA
jgi:hypothetical protein